MTNFYNKDLALIHDEYYGEIAESAAKYILKLIQRGNNSNLNVIDLGCGSGITAKLLCDHGYKVTGVDYSNEILSIAREKAPLANFINKSLFDYQIPQADIITSIGEPFNYLFDNKSNSDNLYKLFKNIYDSLNNDGYLIFDILTIGVLASENPRKRIVETDKWSMFLESSEDVQKHILTRDITLFFKEGDLYRRSKETHTQMLYDALEITRKLEEIGFYVEPSKFYDDLKLREGHIMFTCKKHLEQ